MFNRQYWHVGDRIGEVLAIAVHAKQRVLQAAFIQQKVVFDAQGGLAIDVYQKVVACPACLYVGWCQPLCVGKAVLHLVLRTQAEGCAIKAVVGKGLSVVADDGEGCSHVNTPYVR